MGFGRFSRQVGMGLAAGLVGTAAISLVQLLQSQLKPPSPAEAVVPAKAVEKVFGIRPVNDAAEKRLAFLAQWGYGTVWGVFRSLLDALGIRGGLATTLHTVALQVAAMLMLPGLKVAPPIRQWGATMIGAETGLHAIYAEAAALTYDALKRDRTPAAAPRFAGRLAQRLERMVA